ncbi:MAG: CsbD family protein [Bacteroidota bacterium]
MNSEVLKNHWDQLKNEITTWWDDLTKEDLEKINGEIEKLEEVVQEKMNTSSEQAKKEVEKFFQTQQVFKGEWNQLKGSAQHLWGKLTGSDLDQVEGTLTNLFGKLQEKYGKTAEEAKNEIIDWIDNTNSNKSE